MWLGIKNNHSQSQQQSKSAADEAKADEAEAEADSLPLTTRRMSNAANVRPSD